MRGVYELRPLKGAVGVEIAISDETTAVLAKWFTQESNPVQVLGLTTRFKPESFVSFGARRFGYNGVLEFNLAEGVINARYSRETDCDCSASLILLFRTIGGWIARQATNRIEPMEIEMTFYALGANCSADFHCFVADRYGYGSGTRIESATQAMITASASLRGGPSQVYLDIRAVMSERGAISLYCDRQECSMGAGGCGQGEKFELGPHNCDRAHQQLTFLAGLVELSGQYLDDRGGMLGGQSEVDRGQITLGL